MPILEPRLTLEQKTKMLASAFGLGLRQFLHNFRNRNIEELFKEIFTIRKKQRKLSKITKR